MKYSLKNTFPLGRKKDYGFYKQENLFPLPGMKHSLKNVSTIRKSASTGKKNYKWFPLAEK